MAEVLFDNDGVRVWMDGTSPIIFVKFMAAPHERDESAKLIKNCQRSLKALLNKIGAVYSIIDISECTDKCSLAVLQFCFTCFPQLLSDEIKYLAFVHATAHHAAIENQVSDLLNTAPHHQRGCFVDFFGALRKINMIRQQQNSINL
jgi:hypothetical protein